MTIGKERRVDAMMPANWEDEARPSNDSDSESEQENDEEIKGDNEAAPHPDGTADGMDPDKLRNEILGNVDTLI
jgi:hypothetical protein